MDIMGLVDIGLSYFYDYYLIIIGIVVVVGGLTYWKPKAMLRVMLMAIVIAAVAYFLSMMGDVASTGVSHKKEMVDPGR